MTCLLTLRGLIGPRLPVSTVSGLFPCPADQGIWAAPPPKFCRSEVSLLSGEKNRAPSGALNSWASEGIANASDDSHDGVPTHAHASDDVPTRDAPSGYSRSPRRRPERERRTWAPARQDPA